MTASDVLFSGEQLPFGGLSNEKVLASACPREFKNVSRWSDYVARCFVTDVTTAGWKWKSADAAERRRQRECFLGLLESFDLPHDDKVAIAGWMLSEMLSEVPAN
jgi:hypothetical protein